MNKVIIIIIIIIIYDKMQLFSAKTEIILRGSEPP